MLFTRKNKKSIYWKKIYLSLGALLLTSFPVLGADSPEKLAFSCPSSGKSCASPQNHSEKEAVNILSLDGGGIHGLYQAVLLYHLEKECNETLEAIFPEIDFKTNPVYLHEFFDLITGVSVGALNAVALTLPDSKNPMKPMFSAEDLVEYYFENAQKIFGAPSLMQNLRTGFGLFGAIHPSPKKVFSKIAETKTFADLLPETKVHTNSATLAPSSDPMPTKDPIKEEKILPKKVMVLSYNMTDRQAYFFKSWDSQTNWAQLLDVILASTAAPIYLPTHPMVIKEGCEGFDRQVVFGDGGLSANNPSSCALAEALCLFPPHDERKYNLVSVGCGHDIAPIDLPKNSGILSWGLGTLSNAMTIIPSPYLFKMVDLGLSWRFPFLSIQIPLLEIIVNNQSSEAQSKMLLKGLGGLECLGGKNYYVRLNPVYDAAEANKIDDASEQHLHAMHTQAKEYCEANQKILKETAKKLVQDYVKKKKAAVKP